ncbi:MAG: iron ABC transporter permease [Desulfobacteraceae bacterium]|nr:iron ABC transporter permease [Desulfobacteraceae bacterium]
MDTGVGIKGTDTPGFAGMPGRNSLGCLNGLKAGFADLAKEPVVAITTVFIVCGMLLFIVYPIAMVLIKSLYPDGVFTLSDYSQFFSGGFHLRCFFNSVLLACIATPITTFLAFAFAFMARKGPRPLRTFFRLNAILPFVTPPFVFALALIILGGRNGIISKFFGIEMSLFGWPGVIIAQVLHFIPLAFIMIDSVMASLNPNLDEAAASLGGSQLRTLGTVTVPLCLPGILKAGLMVFILSLADFGNPSLIGGGVPFLATESYLLVIGQNDLGMASVYSVMLLVPSLVLYYLHRYVVHEDKFKTIGGAPMAREEHPVHPLVKVPMLIICIVTSLAILTIFAVIIGGAFTRIIGINNTFTLAHFSVASSIFALKNSIETSFYSSVIGTVAGTILAFILVRKTVPGKMLLEFISLSGFAVPGTIIGIGFIIAFNNPPLALVGTMSIIVLSMIVRTLAVSVEAGMAKLYQIDKSIEEASHNLGAGSVRTFMKVVLPLMFTAFFGGMVYSFIYSMNTLSAVIFVAAPRYNLAPLAIFQLANEGRIGQACALSLFLILSVFLSLGILKAVTRCLGFKNV